MSKRGPPSYTGSASRSPLSPTSKTRPHGSLQGEPPKLNSFHNSEASSAPSLHSILDQQPPPIDRRHSDLFTTRNTYSGPKLSGHESSQKFASPLQHKQSSGPLPETRGSYIPPSRYQEPSRPAGGQTNMGAAFPPYQQHRASTITNENASLSTEMAPLPFLETVSSRRILSPKLRRPESFSHASPSTATRPILPPVPSAPPLKRALSKDHSQSDAQPHPFERMSRQTSRNSLGLAPSGDTTEPKYKPHSPPRPHQLDGPSRPRPSHEPLYGMRPQSSRIHPPQHQNAEPIYTHSSWAQQRSPNSKGLPAHGPEDRVWHNRINEPPLGVNQPMSDNQPSQQPPLYLELNQGHGERISVPINTNIASKQANEKRKRNACASAKFRQRKKAEHVQNKEKIDELENQLRIMETRATEVSRLLKYYRDETNRLRDIVESVPELAHRSCEGPQSPNLAASQQLLKDLLPQGKREDSSENASDTGEKANVESSSRIQNRPPMSRHTSAQSVSGLIMARQVQNTHAPLTSSNTLGPSNGGHTSLYSSSEPPTIGLSAYASNAAVAEPSLDTIRPIQTGPSGRTDQPSASPPIASTTAERLPPISSLDPYSTMYNLSAGHRV